MDLQALAAEYLCRSQLPDGSWGNGEPFVCARAMTALRDGVPEDTLVRGLKYLEGTQEPDGHFGRKTGTYTDAANTAYTMIALNRFDYGKASLPISRGIMWLLENQNGDGSWAPTPVKKDLRPPSACGRSILLFERHPEVRERAGLLAGIREIHVF